MRVEEVTICDPARCPLCGQSNACARAADPEATRCWCKEETFPRELLERVPPSAARRACICARCLREHESARSE